MLPRQVPEFRLSYTITTDKFDALYKQLKPKGVTLTALLAKAAGVALAGHPLLYACTPRGKPPRRATIHLLCLCWVMVAASTGL